MKHLLVVRFSAFGDVAMTVPVIRCFLRQNPDVSITYISQAHLADLFEGIPRLTFVPAELRGKHKGVAGLRKLWSEATNGKRIDAFIDLHSVLRSFILRAFARMAFVPVYSMQKNRSARARLLRGKDKNPLRAIPELYADAFRRAGYTVTLSTEHGVEPVALSDGICQKTSFRTGITSIGIAPFSQYDGKTYPLHRMQEVVDTLASDPRLQIVLVGGRGDEAQRLDSWAKGKENVVCAAGRLTLREELSLMSQLDLMVSMDSANMHLCSMVGTRVISVWGATHHLAGFLGFGQSREWAVEMNDMPCRPCSIFGNKPCRFGTYDCMNRISPEVLIQRIYSALGLPLAG